MKKHDILNQIEGDLEGLDRTVVVQLGAHKFKLRMLSRSEETRARGIVDAENIFTAFADSNVPQLAYATQAINDVAVEELFTPDTEEDTESCNRDPRRWRAMQLAEWYGKQPTIMVEKLWLEYLQLKDKVAKSLEELENFSKTTPGGD